MSLHIAIDGSCLTKEKAGIGFYLARLLQALDRLPGDERYTILSNKPIPDLGLSDRFQTESRRVPSTTLWAQTYLRSRLKAHNPDLFHSAAIGMPLGYRKASVLTAHDLAFLHFPHQHRLATRNAWRFIVPRLIRQCSHVLTNSYFTRTELIRHLNISEDKITATPLAADPVFQPISDREEIRQFREEHGLQRDYILTVGTLEPRKNLPFLMRCFASCVRKGAIDGNLIIVGGKGWLYDEILQTKRQISLGDQVKLVGYVGDQQELRKYYCGCRFFAFPSMFEGFGFPPLEAMSCGVPVISSTGGSLHEVVGEGGLLLSPEDGLAWETALAEWWNAPDLSDWKEKALRQAARFSWQQTAQQTLEVYKRVGLVHEPPLRSGI